MVKDVDLFAAAMGDVKPLAGRKRGAAKVVIPKPKAEGPSKPQKRSVAPPGMTSASSSWTRTRTIATRSNSPVTE